MADVTDLTLQELRLLKYGLNRLPESREVRDLRVKLTEIILEKAAVADMIASGTGQYPAWARHRGLVR